MLKELFAEVVNHLPKFSSPFTTGVLDVQARKTIYVQQAQIEALSRALRVMSEDLSESKKYGVLKALRLDLPTMGTSPWFPYERQTTEEPVTQEREPQTLEAFKAECRANQLVLIDQSVLIREFCKLGLQDEPEVMRAFQRSKSSII